MKRSRLPLGVGVLVLHGLLCAVLWQGLGSATRESDALRRGPAERATVLMLALAPLPAAPAAQVIARPLPVLPRALPPAAATPVPAVPSLEPATAPAAAAPTAEPVPASVPAPTPASPAPATAAPPAPLFTLAHADRRDCPPAPHPAALRERGIEGVVHLRVRVAADGLPVEVRVQQASGWRLLDDAALAQARGCRFVPARRGNEAVESWVEFPVRFALRG